MLTRFVNWSWAVQQREIEVFKLQVACELCPLFILVKSSRVDRCVDSRESGTVLGPYVFSVTDGGGSLASTGGSVPSSLDRRHRAWPSRELGSSPVFALTAAEGQRENTVLPVNRVRYQRFTCQSGDELTLFP